MAELRINTTGKLSLFDADDSHAASIVAGTVTANENVMSLATAGVTFNVPTITLGDATAEDTKLVFDGNAVDYRMGLDDSADTLEIGIGSTHATTAQISLNATGFVFNEQSSDYDFRVESNGNANMLFVDGGNNKVAVGTANPNADFAVSTGYAKTDTSTRYVWGAQSNEASGQAQLRLQSIGHASDNASRKWQFQSSEAGVANTGAIEFQVDGGTVQMGATGGGLVYVSSGSIVFNEGSTDTDFRVESNGNANMLHISGGNDVVGIRAEGDLGIGLHIKESDSGASVDSHANHLVIEHGTSGEGAGMSILTATDGFCRIAFGDSGDNDIGQILYNNTGDSLTFTAGANAVMKLTSSSVIVNEDSDDVDFRVESSSTATMFNLQGANTNNSAGSIGINSSNTDGNLIEAVNPQNGVWLLRLDHSHTGANPYGIKILNGSAVDDQNGWYIQCADSGSVRFGVYNDGDVVNHDNAYGAVSDERIKEQIKDSGSQWDDLKAMKIRKFKFKSDVADKGDSDALWKLGVVAQELEASSMNGLVKPEIQYQEGDQETKDYLYTEKDKNLDEIPEGKDVGDVKQAKTADVGDIKNYKTVKYSILYMKAIKALQEAQTRIETLETKVTALEG